MRPRLALILLVFAARASAADKPSAASMLDLDSPPGEAAPKKAPAPDAGGLSQPPGGPPAADAPPAGAAQSADPFSGGHAESGGAAAAGPGAPGAWSSRPGAGDPADPKTAADLALAAGTGFKEAFEAMGLKAARDGAIVRGDDKPASEAQLAQLKARIRAEPRALLARPDFFSIVPREKFDALKAELAANPGLWAFRDIELTADGRDLARSASCEAMSGRCNRISRASSYRKGELVPPEDLRRLADRDRAKDAEPEPAFDPRAVAPKGAAPEAARGGGPDLYAAFEKLIASAPRWLGAHAAAAGAGALKNTPSLRSSGAQGAAQDAAAGAAHLARSGGWLLVGLVPLAGVLYAGLRILRAGSKEPD